jgi:sulfide:quinone oxidoreductase
MSGRPEPLNVLVVGGGVAGMEAALALRDLAGDRVTLTLLTPEPAFIYRPLRVREPFAGPVARSYPLDEFAREVRAELVQDALKSLDAGTATVHTAAGRSLGYEALLLAPGARLTPSFEHATTLDDRLLDEQLWGLIRDVEGRYVHKIAFVVPDPAPWPLPVYELALMIAQRAYDTGGETSVTILTPEEAPLALFGTTVSQAVQELLEQRGILTVTSVHCEVPEKGAIVTHPGGREMHVDRVVALPRLTGPGIPGVPEQAPEGFIPVDSLCRVTELGRVWAAGDATDFPVKFGGIAAQQADTAAHAIAALAGAEVEPLPFHPEVQAVLLGGDRPLRLRAQITGGAGESSELSELEPGSAPAKISARYLAPYLETQK